MLGCARNAQFTNDEKDFAITRFINICWYFFKLAAVLAVFVAIGLTVFLFTRLDDEIRRQVQLTLAEHFPQYNVSVGGARLIEGQGIAIYDLAFSETTSTQLQNNVLVIDEIMFSCNAKLTELVKGLPDVHRVVVRHPQIWAARDRNGRWNFESLWPLPECGKRKPQIIIENAQLTISDQSRNGLPPLSLRDINLDIQHDINCEPIDGMLRAAADATAAPSVMEVHGSFGGPNVQRAEFLAFCDLASQSVRFTSKLEGLQISRNLLAWAAEVSGNPLRETTLVGKVDGELTIEHSFANGQLPKVKARFDLQEARLDDHRLPRPLTDLSCVVHCDNQMLEVQQLRGTCGAANVSMHLRRRGWTARAPLAVGLRIENVALDQKLYSVMPLVLREQWDKYEPQGVVDADVQATFDGHQWRPIAKLSGRELAFESDKFRYRVHNGYGTMSYTPRTESVPATLNIDLIGYGGGQPLHFEGQVFDPQPGAVGWVTVTGNNVKIEEEMIAALPPQTRDVINSMHPQGKFNVYWRLDRTQFGQEKPHTSMQLEMIDCQVLYDKFPYPLSGINGLIRAEDQRWTFRDLVSGGSRRVQCQGYLQPLRIGDESQSQLFLQFTGQQIPLDDDLRHALPPTVGQAWQELRPRGNVDVQAKVTHLTGSAKPSIHVTVNSHPESTTIQPRFFDYLLEQLEGSFSYSDGKVLMSNVRARHGQTKMRTNGHAEFRDDGSWYAQLEGLAVDRLMARRDLTSALPLKLQRMIEYLQPTGSFDLSKGILRFSKDRGTNASVDAEWDLELNCLQANLHAGIELHNIHGAIRLEGATRGDRSYTAGELAIDTATFEDVQFTEIHGPLWVDEGRCLFGSWAAKEQGSPLRRMSAKVYDGEVIADAGVSFDIVPKYSAIAMLTGANLKRMMKERIDGELDYTGNLSATLTISGEGRSLATLNGHGEVRITEANIYELPILVSMLKVLRNESPNSTAFNQVDSQFRIQGPNIYLEQLDFKGDAVTLKGRGETNFDQDLNLGFHAVIGRDEIRLPLVKNFVDRVGQQTLQMTVDGTWSQPDVRTQPLPAINQLIQNLQIDPNNPDQNATTPRNAERVFPAWPSWGRQ